MKRVALLLGVVLLAGCSNNTPTPAPTVTVTAPTLPQDAEKNYLSDIRERPTATLNATSDYDLVNLGRTICRALESGFPLAEIIYTGTQGSGVTADEMGIVAAASVINLCPEQAEGLTGA